MVEITGVVPGTPAAGAGIETGEYLISINGHKIQDVLDYMFYAADSLTELELKNGDRVYRVRIHKSEYDDLGLEFASFLMDKKQSCCNKCIFCFIDQMPPGMRETLYFKDDDSRLSFLHGNYVTLTNLNDSDVERIIRMKLNINVSVHTTNPELRKRMMHNRFAGEKLKYLWMMAEGGLKLNCQIVLCPGYNDGAELERTLSDFEKMADSITSVAVVPVGVTKYRQGLCPMTTFNEKTAGETIDLIAKYQQRFLEKTGSRKVFPSDEFFLIAKRSLPEAEFYEDYPQYENGVGLMRSLEDEFSMALKINDPPETRRKVTIATGTGVFDFISSLARRAEKEWEELEVRVVAIKNRFFGETITVTGLITAGDLIDQLKDVDIGDELLLSSAMVKADEPVFLDDLTVSDVEKALDTKIRLCPNDGYELLDAINGIRQ